MTPRVVLLVTSPRVAPGLLSWTAWEALRSGPVRCDDAQHPQLPWVRQAGVEVEVLDGSAHDAAARLAELAVLHGSVTWLCDPAGSPELVHALADVLPGDRGTELEVLPASYDLPGARLLDVVAVMDRLRSPGGCPWDAEQTHESLAKHLIEEAYEALEAIEEGDRDALREELGDVLLQVAFHARVAQDDPDEPWSVDDVAGDLVDKLVRRHPHVFAGATADDAAAVEASWEQIKAAEKGRVSVTEGIPLGQPALALAATLQRKALRLGVPLDLVSGTPLLAAASAAGADPEAQLRAEARDLRDRLRAVELRLHAEGRSPADLTDADWRSLLA